MLDVISGSQRFTAGCAVRLKELPGNEKALRTTGKSASPQKAIVTSRAASAIKHKMKYA
ncbi:MAG TPA: hypothetical protein PLA43_18530 [Bryobacteraceae bacterium]|nr:hypothetical protein [Bryobacteraceae bacterium]HOL70416.1 hypothetical protein [Bryobacteraceae bacterium]HOQ46612.1 hypothetical protein [Bryobacteraceae bacterium]HPU73955.1 hypothetical protein [Bryobacteraceae bacterium]